MGLRPIEISLFLISSDDGLILIPLITNPQNLLHKLESLMSTITPGDNLRFE